jgi:metal-responsive CopG/Arc/MetJ family transcriptional regulator
MGIRDWPFVSFNLQPEVLAELNALAEKTGRSRSELLREWVQRYGLPSARRAEKRLSHTRKAA